MEDNKENVCQNRGLLYVSRHYYFDGDCIAQVIVKLYDYFILIDTIILLMTGTKKNNQNI